MKKVSILFAFFFAGMLCQAQILKDLSHRIVNDAESKVQQKVSSKMDQGIDSLTKKRSKTKGKNKNATTTTVSQDSAATNGQISQGNNTTSMQTTPAPASTSVATTGTQQKNPSNNSGQISKPDPYSSDGSFITLKVFPTKVLLKNSVSVSGTSIKFQNLNKVVMTITAENKVSQSKDIPLKDDGTFSTTWQPGGDGNYTIQVKSSDGKALQSEDISVYDFKEMDSVTAEPKNETQKAFDDLKKNVDAILPQLAPKDAADLQKEWINVTHRKDTYIDFLNNMDDAGKQLDALEKQQGPLPPVVASNFFKVTDQILQISDNMKQANEVTAHQPTDNTICEYLVITKEVCAAFSTITDFFTKSAVGILKNIESGSVATGVTGAASDEAGAGGDPKNIGKECAKITATAALSAENMENALSKSAQGFAGDLGAMCADHFLSEYCTSLSGNLSEKYQCTLRNKNSRVWWDYGYTTSATISLRSPKGSATGGIMKMKGNIEGNAIHFSIYQNPKEIDDFQKEMKGRDGMVQMFSICLWSPAFVPFSSTKADQNTGFGAVARSVATPAYFNIPIDADYDVGNKKLTIYVNDAIVDFSSAVNYVYVYIAIAAGIPLFTRVNYPINKVKLTLGKVISDNKTFNVTGDKKVSVKGTGQTHLGDASSSIEQHINLNFLLTGQ